jgi:hypothetical protein
MTALRYTRRALRADYLRAGAGAAFTLIPLAGIPVFSVAGSVLGGLGLLFVAFAGRTWVRQRTQAVVTDDAITVTALGRKTIAWADLTGVELRYFSTRRDRSQGWMQLTLSTGATRIRLESTLERFDLVAGTAAQKSAAKGIALSPSTVDNLRALGISQRDIARTPTAETLAHVP